MSGFQILMLSLGVMNAFQCVGSLVMDDYGWASICGACSAWSFAWAVAG